MFVADSVILAAGMRPLDTLRDRFRGLAFDVIPIGDCKKVGTVYTATSTAYNAVLRI